MSSIYCFNDEIFIPLLNGKLIKVPWNDQARHDHFYLSLQKIFFKYETDGECNHNLSDINVLLFKISFKFVSSVQVKRKFIHKRV